MPKPLWPILTDREFGRTSPRCAQAVLAVAGVSLLFVSPLSAQSDNPTRLRFELCSLAGSLAHVKTDGQWLGFASYDWSSPSILEVGAERGNWRAGVALEQDIVGLEMVQSYAPLHVEYIIWEHPVSYVWVLHGMVPELTARLTGYWLNSTAEDCLKVPAAGRLDVIAGADFWGIGLSFSAGVVAAYTRTNRTARHWDIHTGISPNLEIRLRLLTFGADLTPRGS
jgi:hypothetical protein